MAIDQTERTHDGTLDFLLESTIGFARAVGVAAGAGALFLTDRILPEIHGVGEGNSPLDTFDDQDGLEDIGYAA